MVDWKNIGVPIIAALIVGVGAAIAATINYIILAIFTPVVSITSLVESSPVHCYNNRQYCTPSSTTRHTTAIEIRNAGSASAKDLKLTIKAPPHVTFNHTIFSTERYSENKTGNPSLLELYIPRFVQGPGSLIRIITLIGRGADLNDDYTIYATYDQGSILRSIPILPIHPFDLVLVYLVQIIPAVVWSAIAIFSLVSVISFYKRRHRRKKIQDAIKAFNGKWNERTKKAVMREANMNEVEFQKFQNKYLTGPFPRKDGTEFYKLK